MASSCTIWLMMFPESSQELSIFPSIILLNSSCSHQHLTYLSTFLMFEILASAICHLPHGTQHLTEMQLLIKSYQSQGSSLTLIIFLPLEIRPLSYCTSLVGPDLNPRPSSLISWWGYNFCTLPFGALPYPLYPPAFFPSALTAATWVLVPWKQGRKGFCRNPSSHNPTSCHMVF